MKYIGDFAGFFVDSDILVAEVCGAFTCLTIALAVFHAMCSFENSVAAYSILESA